MIYKGRATEKIPLEVLHRKMPGERKCICGAPLDYIRGEWVHPHVNPMTDLKRFLEYYGITEK